jgi:hypothetical protein
MKRTLAVLTTVFASMAAAAGPAAANLPKGAGLISFGTLTCEGFGDVEVIGPRADTAATGFTTTGVHAVLVSISVVGTDPDGNPFTQSKSYGAKAGLTPLTCTSHFDGPQGTGDVTSIVGIVPPLG